MKKILVCLLAMLLCACANSNDIKTELDKVFVDDINTNNVRANNYTTYIEYYVPSDINEESAEALSYVFNVDGEKFIMNINISSILNTEYKQGNALIDDGFFNKDNLIYTHEGTFNNLNGNSISYFSNVYSKDNECIIYIVTSEVNMYGLCPIEKVDMLSKKMLQIAVCNNVHRNRIIEDFSKKDVIDYQKNAVNLFEKTYPESGRVEDLMIDTSKVPE